MEKIDPIINGCWNRKCAYCRRLFRSSAGDRGLRRKYVSMLTVTEKNFDFSMDLPPRNWFFLIGSVDGISLLSSTYIFSKSIFSL